MESAEKEEPGAKAFLGIPAITGGKTALHFFETSMEMNITEEQRKTLMKTTLQGGQNAWAYTLTWPTDDQPWIAAGILSCMKKGYSLNRLTVNWEARELRYANVAD